MEGKLQVETRGAKNDSRLNAANQELQAGPRGIKRTWQLCDEEELENPGDVIESKCLRTEKMINTVYNQVG